MATTPSIHPSIPEFFTNKTVFITGGTGFIGMVLVEKLLRSCPDLKTIYLLMREKKGRTLEERLKATIDVPLFDLLRSENPGALQKLKPINGDVGELNLGVSPENRELLIQEVNIIFHGAASVRFDDSLTDAILMNTRGTREVVTLALEMKNLEVLVHLSTTYAHTHHKVVEEKLYPPLADWKKTIKLAEEVDRQVLNSLTEKFIHPLPNTYTFAKSLSEQVVYDLCQDKIPLVIYRPSIVTQSVCEPVPGWVQNFNGPMGLAAGTLTGVVRTVYADPEVIPDYVPVDITVKAIIISGWKQATYKNLTQILTPSIYNGSSNTINPVSIGDLTRIGIKNLNGSSPFRTMLWYPHVTHTKCYHYYFIQLLFFHLLPAVVIDGLLKILGKKPMLVKLHRRIFVALSALSFFLNNQWTFLNDKAVELEMNLQASDVKNFNFRGGTFSLFYLIGQATLGVKKYLLKEDNDLEKARKHVFRMWMLAQIFNVLWYLGIVWILFVKIDAISVVMGIFTKFYMYLSTD